MVGVLSERDCKRRVLLPNKSPESTLVGDVEQRHHSGRFAHFCRLLELMHQHGIRQLPVIDQGKPITVVSIRDLLREAAAHHAKIVAELERERITLFISTA
jgi:signal-transduction protein with cAMP-binding, CBS, and nucleotidyltransferase domain